MKHKFKSNFDEESLTSYIIGAGFDQIYLDQLSANYGELNNWLVDLIVHGSREFTSSNFVCENDQTEFNFNQVIISSPAFPLA